MTKLFAALLLAFPLMAQAAPRCMEVHAEHSALEVLCPFKEGMTAFQFGGLWGFADKSGRVAVEPLYDRVEDFSSGLAAVSSKGKWGFVDATGALRVPLQYSWAGSFSDGLAAVAVNGAGGYVDKAGRMVIPAVYQETGPFVNGVAAVRNASGRDALIDKSGAVIKEFGPEVRLNGGRQYFGRYVATVRYPHSLVDADGRQFPVPAQAEAGFPVYGDGVLIVTRQEKGRSLRGVMDMSGNWLVEPRFNRLDAFVSGLAIAQQEGKLGLLNKRGQFVVEPVYTRLARTPSGYYLGEGGHSRTDVLDAAGKRLIAMECPSYEERVDAPWTVFRGCGETWVVSAQGQAQRFAVEAPAISQAGEYLLLSKEEHGGEKGKKFFLLGPQGFVLSSDDAAIKGKYDDVWLVRGGSEADRANPHLLPVAVLMKDYRKQAIVTRQHKILRHEEWGYENVDSDYRYGSGDKLDGPFPVKDGKLFGAVDGLGQWAIPPEFDALSEFQQGLAFGMRHGEEVVVDNGGHAAPRPPGYSFFRAGLYVLAGYDTGSDGSRQAVMYRMRAGKLEKLVLPGNLVWGDFSGEGLIPAMLKEKWGLLRIADGQWALPPNLASQPEPLRQGKRLLGWKTRLEVVLDRRKEYRYGLVSPSGKELFTPRYAVLQENYQNSGLLRISRNGQMSGLAAPDGREILPPAYETVNFAGNGGFFVQRAEERGLVDTRGNWTVTPGRYFFQELDKRPYSREEDADGEVLYVHVNGALSTRKAPRAMPDDRAEYWWTDRRGVWGEERTTFYGFDWKERLRLAGDAGEGFSGGWVVLRIGDPENNTYKSVLASAKGKTIGPLPFNDVKPMKGGMFHAVKTVIQTGKDGASREIKRHGFLDTLGNIAVPFTFEDAGDFSEGRAVVVSSGNLGFVDKSGQLILHGEWLCEKYPALLNGDGGVVWPKGAAHRCAK